MNFHFITERVATGSDIRTDMDVKVLIAHNITHIIDCHNWAENWRVLQFPNVSYLLNGTSDDGHLKPAKWFQKSIQFALEALQQPRTKIYCHCLEGINRGPSTAYAILRAQGIKANIAERWIRRRRPQVGEQGLCYKSDADRAVIELGYTSELVKKSRK